MQSNKHIIVFSHGFGVRKDDRGLLSNIAENLSDIESVLFDYSEIDEINHTITVQPFSKQAKILKNILSKIKKLNPGATIDLICHSQGTIVSALANPRGIRKTIFLSPVFDTDINRTLNRYKDREDAEINLKGISKLPILDGLVRVVPSKYWKERKKTNAINLYNKFSKKTEIIVINANQDELLKPVDLKELSDKIKITSLDGDHMFSGENRKLMLETVKNYIMN